MGSRLPVVSGREVVAVLQRIGFEFLPKRGKGSHLVVARREPATIITVPDHRELDRGTFRGIIRSAGISVDEFVRLLND